MSPQSDILRQTPEGDDATVLIAFSEGSSAVETVIRRRALAELAAACDTHLLCALAHHAARGTLKIPKEAAD